ncbi:lambda exonuclease family protein [Aeromicrobium sp.]|uniref:lambda exonuclease family protein n=1 Tax=Aeromicrobium sp. TaxID=1871063 RepID=UPI002FCC55B3
MTLHEYKDVDQGSDEWLDLRRGLITASTIGRLITPKTIKPAGNPDSRALIAELAAERIAGWSDPVYVNSHMQRGKDCEPLARDLYSERYAPVTEIGFLVEDNVGGNGFKLGYSPDGLVSADGLIEVKAPEAKTHIQTILSGEVPPGNMAQCQSGLLVSGRDWLDFLSYSPGLPMWRTRVLPDPRWAEAIIATVEQAELAIESMVNRYQGAVIGLPATERIVELEMVIGA